MSTQRFKWKTILALAIVYVAVFKEWNWPWGVLFIMWTVPALYSGRTYFVEEIDRRNNPILFWIIVGTWITLSIFMIAYDLANFI